MDSQQGTGREETDTKRHRKVLRNNTQGISKPAIRRLARQGGVKRISGLIYEEIRGILKVFLENIIRVYNNNNIKKQIIIMIVIMMTCFSIIDYLSFIIF